MKLDLFSYQTVASSNCCIALNNTGNALLIMVMGLGKTIVSIHVAEQFCVKQNEKILFLCHETGILDTNYKKYQKYSTYTCARMYGDHSDDIYGAQVVFTTFQSMYNQSYFKAEYFTMIIVDESHHSQATTFREVIEFFQPLYRLAITATPDREDGKDISELFGLPVYELLLPEAIAKEYLVPVRYKVLCNEIDDTVLKEMMSEVFEEGKKVTAEQINKRLFIQKRSEEQAKIILEHAKIEGKGMVFCKDTTHTSYMQKILPHSRMVHSKQSNAENEEVDRLFEQDKIPFVLTVNKYNEGRDIPSTKLICFLRNTGSRTIFYQQLGRGLRLFEGKDHVTILDFVANIERILEIQQLVREIKRYLPETEEGDENLPLFVTGNGFSFEFSEQIVDILEMLKRSQEDPYPTLEEAREAALRLGLDTKEKYIGIKGDPRGYRQDPKLPATSSFKHLYGVSGFPEFIGKEDPYPTLEEAREAALRLGLDTQEKYCGAKGEPRGYRQDPKLPATSSFKHLYGVSGFPEFIGKEDLYPTLEEVREVALRLGLDTKEKYKGKKGDPNNLGYRQDTKLPCWNPTLIKRLYGVSGFPEFIGKKK